MIGASGSPIAPSTILNAHALNHPKVVEFAQAISAAEQTGNMDLIRIFLTRELATFISSGIYGQAVFEATNTTVADFINMVRITVRSDAQKASGIVGGGLGG